MLAELNFESGYQSHAMPSQNCLNWVIKYFFFGKPSGTSFSKSPGCLSRTQITGSCPRVPASVFGAAQELTFQTSTQLILMLLVESGKAPKLKLDFFQASLLLGFPGEAGSCFFCAKRHPVWLHGRKMSAMNPCYQVSVLHHVLASWMEQGADISMAIRQ